MPTAWAGYPFCPCCRRSVHSCPTCRQDVRGVEEDGLLVCELCGGLAETNYDAVASIGARDARP